MNLDEVNRLHARIKITARILGFGTIADDMAQEIICRMLEGRHEKSTVSQAAIDYLRNEFGRDGSPKQALTKNTQELTSWEKNARTYPNVEKVIDAKRIVGKLTDKEATAVIMHYVYGYSLAEVADILRVTESRVSQFLQEITEKMLRAERRRERFFPSGGNGESYDG